MSSAFCQGTWITPINPETKALDADKATSVVTADYGHYNPAGDSVLEGNVVIDQEAVQFVPIKSPSIKLKHLHMHKAEYS
ncbi:hypothetical protein AQ482_10535 [Acinetobacter baumannii]|nr:hypothetical protein AQ482_10535 [Acinetobacter baumannii]